MRLNHFMLAGAAAFLIVAANGCATQRQTLESRKAERATTYANLSPEERALVDAGKIKVGMPMDAVYIALGKPSQILNSESSQGTFVTWVYKGTHLQEYRYWRYDPLYYGHGRYYSWGPTLESDYYPVPYMRGEVVFLNGVVKEWRTFPAPLAP